MKSNRILGLVIGATTLLVVGQATLVGCAAKSVVGPLQRASEHRARSNEYVAVLGQTHEVTKALVLSAAKTTTFPSSLDGLDLGGLPLQLNPKLAGVSFKAVKNPGKTVLVYEGAPGAPLFSHNGKAALGFADGHAQLMDEKSVKAQKVRWEP